MSEQKQVRKKSSSPSSPTFTPRSSLVQRKCACGGSAGVDGECSECRSQQMSVQRAPATPATPATQVPPIVHEVLSSPGQSLDTDTRAYMEPRFGHDFSKVRIHADGQAAESAQAINALAYTSGRDIAFEAGQYMPETTEGKKLLAHELTHVVQQEQSVAKQSFSAKDLSMSSPSNYDEQVADNVASHLDQMDNRHSVQNQNDSHSSNIPQTPTVQRKENKGHVTMPDEKVEGDPQEAKRTFSQIRDIVQLYCNDKLNYFSLQYHDAVTLFQVWYKDQPQADASFFINIINVIMNSAWAWGSPMVGAIVAPIGSVIMLAAQEAASNIKAANDQFADSLVASSINFESKLQHEMGDVPALLEQKDSQLWQEITMLAYLGEDWHPLIHNKAGLPSRGIDYKVKLLSQLIFEYQKWSLSHHSRDYQGAYSLADPKLEHMQGRAQAEAHVMSALPIPKEQGKYSRPGEKVSNE